MSRSSPDQPLTLTDVVRLWWPLAASWLLMGVELPLLSAVVARLPHPEIHLAAYGSIVFPVSLVIEAPIIMLLAASTALSVDASSYRKLLRFTTTSGALLTALHLLIALTPLYDVIATRLLSIPAEVLEPGRLGLLLMTPWSWSIADRRFHQGVLIRGDRARVVGFGTLVRLAGNAVGMGTMVLMTEAPGIAVGTVGVSCGVLSEALFVRTMARASVERLPEVDPSVPTLTRAGFFRFYLPLALTPLLTLLNQPLGAAAMGRMPASLPSLAGWPPIHGFVFLPRAVGFALNEVVVSLAGRSGARPVLWRFTLILTVSTGAFLLLVALTPLGSFWFERISGLQPELASLCAAALIFAVPLPALQALQSWYQGILVHRRRTRVVTEAVVVYLLLVGGILAAGIHFAPLPGLSFTLLAFGAGALVQTVYLALRTGSTEPRPAVAIPRA